MGCYTADEIKLIYFFFSRLITRLLTFHLPQTPTALSSVGAEAIQTIFQALGSLTSARCI